MSDTVSILYGFKPSSLPDKWPKEQFAEQIECCLEIATLGAVFEQTAEPAWDLVDDALFSMMDNSATSYILPYTVDEGDNDEHLTELNTRTVEVLVQLYEKINPLFNNNDAQITRAEYHYLQGELLLELEKFDG